MVDKGTSDRLDFWNSRASLGFAAGSNDVNLKSIEIKALNSVVPFEGDILDAGCGNAHTISAIASSRPANKFYGFDYSLSMIDEGNKLISQKPYSNRILLRQGDLLHLDHLDYDPCQFSCIYTQRSLINLDSLDDQLSVIHQLWSFLRPGGLLALCESFYDGLDEINTYRLTVGLNNIEKPWHNSYFRLGSLASISDTLNADFKVIEFSGSYYFVSRVLHAWQANHNGQDPSYDDDVNLMALGLPPLPVCGQSKLIVFQKPTVL